MSSRDPWLDNAKFWLVALVVVGHALVIIPNSEVRNHTYDFLYQFHVPAFVLISGYLSRSFAWTRRHLAALATTLLLPYVVFELAMALWRVHLGDVSSLDVLSPLWLNPHWPMWYLIVLALWRLATPVLKLHWLMVPAAFAVSLVGGAVNWELFDLNRAMGFLPFFVLGLHLPELVTRFARARWSWIAGAAAMAWLWWFAADTDARWTTEWFYHRASYGELGATFTEGVSNRVQMQAVALLGAVAALTLIPRRASFISVMGAYSLVVYLLHGFVLKVAETREWGNLLPHDDHAALAITVVLSTALAGLLAWPPVASRLVWTVDPVGTARKRHQLTR